MIYVPLGEGGTIKKWVGQTLARSPRNSLEECQEECNKDPRCMALEYAHQFITSYFPEGFCILRGQCIDVSDKIEQAVKGDETFGFTAYFRPCNKFKFRAVLSW